jgi:hypothetical protein
MKQILTLVCFLALSLLVLAAGSSMARGQASAGGAAAIDITYVLQQNEGSLSFNLQAPAYTLEAGTGQPGSVSIQVLDESQRYTNIRPTGAMVLPHRQFNLALPPDADLSSLEFVIGAPEVETLPGHYTLPTTSAWVDACSPNQTNSLPGAPLCSARGLAAIPGMTTLTLPDVAAGPAPASEKDTPILVQLPPAELRQWRYARLDFSPFHYDTASGQLQVVRSVSVQVKFRRSPAGLNPVLLSQGELGERLAQVVVDNFIDARQWYQEAAQSNKAPLQATDYIILGSQEALDQPAVGEFMLFLNEHGHEVTAFPITSVDSWPGADRAEKTRAFLRYYYENQGLMYVLFIGDQSPLMDSFWAPGALTGDVPMKTLYMEYFISGKQWPGATDRFYENLTSNWDMNGDGIYGEFSYTDNNGFFHAGDLGSGGMDFTPQIFVGRIPAVPGHYDEINPILRKIIAYESITVRQAWQDRALLAMSFYDHNWDGGLLGHVLNQNLLYPAGYSSYRMYNYHFDPVDSVCDQLSSYSHDESLKAHSVVTYWSQNPVGLMVWAGHGWQGGTALGWSSATPPHDCSNFGDLFNSGQAAQLNDNSPAFTFSISCLNGYEGNAFQPYTSITDNVQYALLRNGAVTSVSSDRVVKLMVNTESGLPTSYASGEGLAYNYVNLLLQGYTAGQALGLIHAYYYPAAPDELLNYEDFTLYGDPATVMYVPPAGTLQAPTGLSADKLLVEGKPAFYLHWQGHSDPATQYYRISMLSSGGETITNASQNAVASLLKDAICSTSYTLKVKAVNRTTESPWSDPLVTGSTPCPPATPPEAVWATPFSSGVDVHWTQVSDNSYHVYRYAYIGNHIIYFGDPLIATLGPGVTNYMDSGAVCGGSHYIYSVATFNPGGESNPTPSDIVNTLPCLPNAPVITDITRTQTSLTVQWTDPNSDEITIIVSARINNGPWQWLAVLPPDSTSFTYDKLTCSGPQVEFQILVSNDGGWAMSNVASMHTSVCTLTNPPSRLMGSPNFKATTKLSLNWIDGSDNEWGYKVMQHMGAAWVLVGTTSPDASSFQVGGLAPNHPYDFEVLAFNGAGDSTPLTVTASTQPFSLVNPSGFHVTHTGLEQIELAWTPPTPPPFMNLTGYHLLRTQDPAHDPWEPVDAIAAPAASYPDINLLCGTTYYYSLNAYGTTTSFTPWESPFTTPISTTTLMCPPPQPTGLHVTGASHTILALAWQPPLEPPDLYSVEYYDTFMSTWTPIITPTGVSTSTVINNLGCGSTYDFRMRAKNASGYSAYSAVLTAGTAACLPTGPSTLSISGYGQTFVSLTWTDKSSNEDGFQVERSVPGSRSWTGVFTTTANLATGTDNSATCGQQYTYRVFAYNHGGFSDTHAKANAATLPCTPLLQAKPGVQGLVMLSWSDPGATSTSYDLERSLDNSIWNQLGEAGGGQTSLRDLNAPCGTRLYYRIRSNSLAGSSPNCSPVTADTECAPLGSITAQATALSHDSIRIDWTVLSGVSGYRVERSLTGLGDWQLVGSVRSGTHTFTERRLETATRYMYRVIGYNTGGSITSNTTSTQTLYLLLLPVMVR